MLPKEFKDRMTEMLGEESDAFFSELESGEAVRAFRVNEIKISAEEFQALDPEIHKVAASFPCGSYYTEEEYPGSLPCHHAGMIYMQDPSAMATVHAVKVEKGMKVLDSCSAPGGKTTQLAAMVGNEGLVVANEYEAKRCRVLQGNVERMGCSNTVVVNLDTAILAKTYPDTFDLVLCDAPCSGEGMFRKNSLAISEWSLDNVKMCAERQREILANVAKCVAPTGYLIYSTCTFSQEENERNVQWFLDEHENFELCEVEGALKAVTADGVPFDGCTVSVEKTRRFYPHVTPGEGQFIALLRRREEEIFTYKKKTDKEIKKKRDEKPKNMPDVTEAARFLRENLVEMPKGELISLGGSVYLKPDIALPAYGVFSAGVCVGSVVGKTFVPHHQLFSAMGAYFKRQVRLEYGDDRVRQYLKGYEIPTDGLYDGAAGDGFAAVMISGCAVGGGKVSGGVCKNHYPKGLRAKQS